MSHKPSAWKDVHLLANELELKIHLADLGARDRWADLLPRLRELDTTIDGIGERAGSPVTAQVALVGRGLRRLRDELSDELHLLHCT